MHAGRRGGERVQYLLLIYGDEAGWIDMDPAGRAETMAAYGTFTESIRQSGNLVDGSELAPTTTATTVRVRDGVALTTDGPFAETKEQLGGYYVVDCADLDEALAIAARIPGALHGSIEVRPTMEVTP
jgi:hypothetical protein